MSKLKVSIVSDLHLEFGYQTLPGGDVLILAGDICESRSLQKDFLSTKDDIYEPGKHPSWDFFKFECAKYNKVFYVMGNHEHYHGKFHKTYDTIKSVLPHNVVLLEKECVEYNGVVFLGGTLWTDLNKGDPITVFTVKDYMSDYKYIQNYYPTKGLYYKLTPDFTVSEFRKTKEYFKFVLEENRTKPVVVITHMAPSFQSVNAKYKDAGVTNAAYASELDEFILDNDNIKFWVHGHMHDPVDYMIGSTRVISNPRGYVPWELGNGFNSSATFDVEV
jgi:Icc-related predicted phosphoesterase